MRICLMVFPSFVYKLMGVEIDGLEYQQSDVATMTHENVRAVSSSVVIVKPLRIR
jgi:hypothetical protein